MLKSTYRYITKFCLSNTELNDMVFSIELHTLITTQQLKPDPRNYSNCQISPPPPWSSSDPQGNQNILLSQDLHTFEKF